MKKTEERTLQTAGVNTENCLRGLKMGVSVGVEALKGFEVWALKGVQLSFEVQSLKAFQISASGSEGSWTASLYVSAESELKIKGWKQLKCVKCWSLWGLLTARSLDYKYWTLSLDKTKCACLGVCSLGDLTQIRLYHHHHHHSAGCCILRVLNARWISVCGGGETLSEVIIIMFWSFQVKFIFITKPTTKIINRRDMRNSSTTFFLIIQNKGKPQRLTWFSVVRRNSFTSFKPFGIFYEWFSDFRMHWHEIYLWSFHI